MFVFSLSLYIAILVSSQVLAQEIALTYRWNVMEFEDTPRDPSYQINDTEYYIASNNIPTGLTPHNNRLFISIARTNNGIPSTLNYIDLRKTAQIKNPALRGYPNYEFNELHADLRSDTDRIVSVYRTRADDCNRLWFVDTGAIEIDGEMEKIQNPSLWIYDLRNDKKLRRFELADEFSTEPNGLQSITVDSDRGRCEDAHAYIPNSRSNKLIVYSFRENDAWLFKDLTFVPKNDLVKLKINDNSYDVNEGIYSVALGTRSIRERARPLYFHPVASNFEYSVSNKVLKTKSNSNRPDNGVDFKYVGTRGEKTQSGIHEFESRTKVIFFTQLQKNAIMCWNTEKSLNPQNVATVQKNSISLVYVTDIKSDRGNIWYLSNQYPILKRTPLDPTQANFFIFRLTARTLINGTICEPGAVSGINDWDSHLMENAENSDASIEAANDSDFKL